MKKILAMVLVAAALMALFAGCTVTQINTETTRVIADGAGRQVEVPEKVNSVVCVGVGALRYTCYMGAQDLVIGVEDYEVKEGMTRLYQYVNFEKFKNLPIIGTNGVPYTEEIIHLAPDVLLWKRMTCKPRPAHPLWSSPAATPPWTRMPLIPSAFWVSCTVWRPEPTN